MKHVFRCFLAALLVSSSTLFADAVRFRAVPNSGKVKIEGTSTVHDWTMEGTIIGGWFDFDAEYPLDPTAPALKPLVVKTQAEVNIPVKSIKSGKKRMDEVMLEAMKQVEFPRIAFKLAELKPKTEGRKAGTPIEFEAKGDLTIAGVTKPIEMPVTIQKAEGSRLKITGLKPLKMTDFGIKPPAPTIALGLIKVGDDIKISFEWIVQPKADDKK